MQKKHLNRKMKQLIVFASVLIVVAGWPEGSKEFFENEWVVKIAGGPEVAEMVAEEMGYKYHGTVVGFKDTYLLSPKFHPTHQKRDNPVINLNLNEHQRVLWAEQQQIKIREKRDETINVVQPQPAFFDRFIRVKRNGLQVLRNDRLFNDELWSQEWYLQDTRTRQDLPKLDLNVLPVYRAGITGKGIRVTILDDGIEYTHDDLKTNYDPDISYDCNENDLDPLPKYDAKHRNSHGTRCAGEVAMVADNGKCGVGIAFNAKIGGIRMLDGFVNDRVEGTALGYAQHLVDIYSASWGPSDDGKTVDGPGSLAKEAIERGIREGRKGLGAIYVWASGNGGGKGDNCNCDGYIASPYTIAVGSASQRGAFPWYGEQCASTMAVTYSSGAYRDQMIATTDLGNKCTIKHTGTSASAPLAAGIIALALEANPLLTWRDVQHLIVWTSEYAPVADNPGWQLNAAGFWFNTRFGFGLMNAHGFVAAATNWTSVSKREFCRISTNAGYNSTLVSGESTLLTFDATSLCPIRYLEHVEVKTTIHSSARGDLEIYLTSAQGTKVQLLGRRKLDRSNHGFKDWTFMSVMTWGENPAGLWTLEVSDQNDFKNNTGSVEETWLYLYGTSVTPTHMQHGSRKYNENYNRVHKNINSLYDDGYVNKYYDYYSY